MFRGIAREARWGVGLGFIVGFVVLLLLAIQTFEGAVTVILLVGSAVFLLVGLYFLVGDQESQPEPAGMAAGMMPPPPPAASTPKMASAPVASAVLVVCPHCRQRTSASFDNCANCGKPLVQRTR